jgi:GcrA cell cycle regulator
LPIWQLETSSPELTPPPASAGANEELCLMSATTLLRRRERDQEPRPTLAKGLDSSNGGNRTPRTIAHGATWTTERVEQLKICIGAGLTCSQIAAEIGVSRNAVIGKMNRLGLSRPREVLAREPAAKRAAWRSRNVTRLFTQHRIFVELPPATAEATALYDGRGCSLLELGPGKCRWPISEPGTRDFCFCGSQQVEGLPYCAGHARLAYKSAARV